eukprot:4859536-Amphidinium_carterae.1
MTLFYYVLPEGEIAALQGLTGTVTGDTLCNEQSPVVLERITIPEPVLQVSCEAATVADTEGLQQALRQIVSEDPSLRLQVDADTNQTLLQGRLVSHNMGASQSEHSALARMILVPAALISRLHLLQDYCNRLLLPHSSIDLQDLTLFLLAMFWC